MNVIGDFNNRTALVAGATCPLGWAACLRLARAGAQVVAMDKDETALQALAKLAPDRINTLPMSVHSEELFMHLGHAWGQEPLYALMNFIPVSQARAAAQISVKTALIGALGPGLIAGQGAVVTVMREASSTAPVADHGQVGAVLSMLKAHGPVLRAQGVRSNAIVLGADVPTQAALSTSLYLISRFSRRLNGVVLPIGAT